jgi:hypothetical protein
MRQAFRAVGMLCHVVQYLGKNASEEFSAAISNVDKAPKS